MEKNFKVPLQFDFITFFMSVRAAKEGKSSLKEDKYTIKYQNPFILAALSLNLEFANEYLTGELHKIAWNAQIHGEKSLGKEA
jgi:hypothetical protein